jgi:chemotaxis protein MotA
MDIATLIGILGGLGCIFFAIFLGAGIKTFVHIPSMMITVGGMFAATLINFPLPEILKISKAAIKVFRSHSFDPSLPILTIIAYAEKARRESLLGLEQDVEDVEDEFLKLGMRLIIDGTDPEVVRSIMETEIDYIEMRHRRRQQLFLAMAKYSPGFGMLGTLIGLVSMLKTMDDPSTIGPSMAVALLTTFYGTLMANLVFMPIAGKLKVHTADESLVKRITLEGILLIQAQINPRYVGQRLAAYLPSDLKESVLLDKRRAVSSSETEAQTPVGEELDTSSTEPQEAQMTDEEIPG